MGWVGGGTYQAAPAGIGYFENSAVDQTSNPLRVLRPAIYKTRDAGRTWRAQRLASDEYRVRRILFVDDEHGLAITDYSAYWTITGGERWTRAAIKIAGDGADHRSALDGRAADVFMLDHQEGWLLFEDGHLLKTTNGGRTWVELAPLVESGGKLPISRMQFISSLRGWGLDEIEGAMYQTDSGGKNWRKLNLNMRIEAFFILDREHAWLIGEQSTGLCRDLYP